MAFFLFYVLSMRVDLKVSRSLAPRNDVDCQANGFARRSRADRVRLSASTRDGPFKGYKRI